MIGMSAASRRAGSLVSRVGCTAGPTTATILAEPDCLSWVKSRPLMSDALAVGTLKTKAIATTKFRIRHLHLAAKHAVCRGESEAAWPFLMGW
jgi:hypothetical protein